MKTLDIRKALSLTLCAAMVLPGPLWAAAASVEDTFRFFEQEAIVVTASRIPSKMSRVPATVHVVTSEDIKASGALNVWDALRVVPGLDIMSTKTSYADMNARGLNRVINNRIMVLLDGKSATNPFYDITNWASIPVTLEEIDRIEVVEGPASALYGANAMSGVVNIITKRPEQLKGGMLAYTFGERNVHQGTLLYGNRKGPWAYKAGVGMENANRFENADLRASEIQKFHSLVRYSPSDELELSLSGGHAQIKTQTDLGQDVPEEGPSGFIRADARYAGTRLRTFWNSGKTIYRDYASVPDRSNYFDTYDASLEHTLSLPFGNELIAGTSYRRNLIRSTLFDSTPHVQDLWAFYFEDQWKGGESWTLVAGGRLDSHPYTKLVFSPRGSVLYHPVKQHTLRLSAGTSFRNPTPVENAIHLDIPAPNAPGSAIPNPPYLFTQNAVLGNKDLSPEKIITYELEHNGDFGRVRTTATGFYYEIRNVIDLGAARVTSVVPPTFQTASSYINKDGVIAAIGGEFGSEVAIREWLSGFANYSYQSIRSVQVISAEAVSPRHKVNGGLRAKSRGLTANLWVHWVDQTVWGSVRLSDYHMINAALGYRFPGRLNGLEIGVSVFNLTDYEHYEIPPGTAFGLGGEIIKSRVTGTVRYSF